MQADCKQLSDAELTASLKALMSRARKNLVVMLQHLAEFDRRKLADKAGFPSLFVYCTKELRCSEGEAARRIQASRAAVRFPVLYRLIGSGRLSLTAVSLLAPHLTKDNRRALLKQALGKSTREVEALVASLIPGQERRDCIRYIGTTAQTPLEPPSCAQTQTDLRQQEGMLPDILVALEAGTRQSREALAPGPALDASASRLVHISFTANEKLIQQLSRAKELLRHKYHRASLEDVFGKALEALLDLLDPDRRHQRCSQAQPPGGSQVSVAHSQTSKTRRIPQQVKDEIWARDQGACSFTSPDGRRCGERGGLEYDHVLPWAKGGRSDDAANIRLLCRAHNQLEARRVFGDAAVEAAILRQQKWLRDRRGIDPSWSCNPEAGSPS